MQAAREAAARLQCANNLKQIGLASHNFEGVYGRFPSTIGTFASSGGTAWSVHSRLLPFIEQDNLDKTIDYNLSYDAQPQVTQQRIAVFMCPSELNDAATRRRIGFFGRRVTGLTTAPGLYTIRSPCGAGMGR